MAKCDSDSVCFVFRNQCCWAWSCSCSWAAGRGPGSWRPLRRITVRPPESTRRKIQPRAGLNPIQSPPSLHPLISEFIFCFFLAPNNEHLSLCHRNQSPPHPQVHCFDTSLLKTVLYCLFCFDRSTLCISKYSTWFRVYLYPWNAFKLPERVQGSHF